MNRASELQEKIKNFVGEENEEEILVDDELGEYFDHEDDDLAVDNEIDEVKATKKIVVRGGRKVIKMSCPPGFKFDPKVKACIKLSAAQQRTASKAAIKGARKRKGKGAAAAKARAKSLKKRAALGI